LDATLKILELARVQHGVVSRQQLIRAGLSASLINHFVVELRLVPLFPGVYGAGHDVVSPRGWWTAALLSAGPGSALSHTSAAAVWNLISPRSRCEVVRGSYRRQAGAENKTRFSTDRSRLLIHRSRCLPGWDIAVREGFRVTSVARTILDLARSMSEGRLRSLLVEAERLRIFDGESLREVSSRGSGWAGAPKLRSILAEWDPALDVTRSVFEEKFLSFCRSRGLPLPAVNVVVEGFEVDCLWASHGLIVELDGFATHSDLKSFDADRRRDSILRSAGLDVRRVTYRQLRDDPAFVLEFVLGRLANRNHG
jgi:very-short-patch-repair endonuclease